MADDTQELIALIELPPALPAPLVPPTLKQCTLPAWMSALNSASVGRDQLPLKPPRLMTGSPVASW